MPKGKIVPQKAETVPTPEEELIKKYEREVAELEQIHHELEKIKKELPPPTPSEEPSTPTPPPPSPPPPPPSKETPSPIPVPVRKVTKIKYEKKAIKPPEFYKPSDPVGEPKVKPERKMRKREKEGEVEETVPDSPDESGNKWTVIFYEDQRKKKETKKMSFRTAREAADVLGVSTPTIGNWSKKGKDLRKPYLIIKK